MRLERDDDGHWVASTYEFQKITIPPHLPIVHILQLGGNHNTFLPPRSSTHSDPGRIRKEPSRERTPSLIGSRPSTIRHCSTTSDNVTA
jgi:hypothetical protein